MGQYERSGKLKPPFFVFCYGIDWELFKVTRVTKPSHIDITVRNFKDQYKFNWWKIIVTDANKQEGMITNESIERVD